MCKVTVNDCLPLLKFVPDCFVTKKMLKDLDNTVFFNGDIVFVNEDSDNPTPFSDDMGLVNVNLNVSLDDVNLGDNDSETIIYVRFKAWRNRYKQSKAYKKEISKKLMPVAWNYCVWFWGLQLYKKGDSNKGVFMWIQRNFSEYLF